MDRIAAGLGALTGFGGTRGDYSGNLAQQRAIDQQFETAHPGMATAGRLAGGIMAARGSPG